MERERRCISQNSGSSQRARVPSLGSSQTSRQTDLLFSPSSKHRFYIPAGDESPLATPAPHDDGKLPLSTVAAYSVGHVLNDEAAACWFSYLLLFLEDVARLKPALASVVMFSGQISDGLATPIAGLISDNNSGIPCLRLGRRKAVYFVGTILVALCYSFVFGFCLPCAFLHEKEIDVSQTTRTVYYAIAASLFNVGWAAVQVSHMSLVPDITPHEDQRILLNSARYAFTIVSNVVVFIVVTLTLAFTPGANQLVDDQASQMDPEAAVGGWEEQLLAPVRSAARSLAESLSDQTPRGLQDPKTFQILASVVLVTGIIMSTWFLIGTPERLGGPPGQRRKEALELSDPSPASGALKRSRMSSSNSSFRQSDPAGPGRESMASSLLPADHCGQLRSGDAGAGTPPLALTGSQLEPVDEEGADAETGSAGNGSMLPPRAPAAATSGFSDNRRTQSVDALSIRVPGQQRDLSRAGGAQSASSAEAPSDDSPTRVPMTWSCWFKRLDFYLVGVNYMGTRLMVNVSQVYIPFYVQQTLGMAPSAVALVPLVVYLSSFAATLLVKRVNLWLGRKLTYTAGAVLCSLACVLFLLMQPKLSGMMYLAAVLLGAGNATVMVTSVSLEADLVGDNTESGAFVYGAMSFTDKLSNGIVILLVGIAQQNLASMCGESHFFRIVIGVIPMASVIVAAAFIFLVSIESTSSLSTAKSGAIENARAAGEERDDDDDEEAGQREGDMLLPQPSIN